MIEGIIKITGEDKLYFDSITKQYKSVMHCPYCGKLSGCWCYPDFESIPIWNTDYPNIYCSDRCFVLDSKGDVRDIAKELSIAIKPTMEEWNAAKIVKVLMDDCELDWDISGSSCET